MTHLKLNLTSTNTFSVALEADNAILGYVCFELDQDQQQPLGYRFRPSDGEYGPLHPTIADTLRERFGDVKLTIEALGEI